MKKAKKLIGAIVFTALVFIWMFLMVLPQYDHGFNAAFLDKYNTLKQIDKPKIVLVGDSNVAFGFDCKQIEKAFNMPVINMGLHAGIGQTFYTDMIKDHINKGDIIIILPHSYNVPATINDATLAWTVLENNFSLYKNIRPQDYKILLNALPSYYKKSITSAFENFTFNFRFWQKKPYTPPKTVDNVYLRASFNEYGDINVPRPNNIMENGYTENAGFEYGAINDELIEYWNEYNQYVLQKGATMFMGVPPIMKPTLKSSEEQLSEFQNTLAENLDFSLISNFSDYIYEKEYFYDTNYHLNDSGVQLRTEQLIKDLKKAIE